MKDYYVILGVPTTATGEEIDAAFRRLARKYHPDVQPEEEDAVAIFKSVIEAHEVLSNATSRLEYDRVHARRQRRIPISPGEQPGGVWGTFENPPQDWGKASWMPAGRKEATSGRSPDIEAELRLVPEEAARGGPVEVRISVDEPCPACRGRGSAPGNSCKVCHGQRTVRRSRLLQLHLPPRLRDGTVLRMADRGGIAASGDLYLRVRVRPCW